MKLIENKAIEVRTSKNSKKTIIYTIWLFLTSIFFICALSTRTYIHQGGSYNDKNHVSLYIYTYKSLPSNYVSKQETSDSGIQPSDGKYIGGNTFYYSGSIKQYTSNKYLREADVEYPSNTTNRGVKRLVYTVDCDEVFYTDDHYETFTRVTAWSINGTSNVFWIFFGTIVTIGIGFTIYSLAKSKESRDTYKLDVAIASKNYLKIIGYTILTPFVLIYMLFDSIIKKIKSSKKQ